ncbi:MAG TPA: tyrosine-type recombinase/integrase [Sphingomicrobium sp.]|nr:tyrosine-type recombinase/integrase [Sphingomicrobium sp.]
MPDLTKVSARETLRPRGEPYWHRLWPGCFLGYRPSKKGGAGTWIARAYDDEQCKYQVRALGSFAQNPPRERFTFAKKATEIFAADVERGGLPEETVDTVADACRKFGESRPEDEARFRRFVYSDPLGNVRLTRLRRSHVEHWRARLAETPARVSRRKKGKQVTRPRSPATLNRDMAALRTALGRVMALGRPNSDGAWQEALRPIKNATRRRTLYLSREQRRSLLEHMDSEAEPFVRALCFLPLRPGAIAALTVGDFDARTSELTILKDKAGERRRIMVPEATARLFEEAAKNKRASDPLFTRSNGTAWDKNSWKVPIAAAARAAKLPSNVTAYTLRHSTITDLVGSGLPLLTIAQISGTSAEMIEKHYGHLARDAAVEALAQLAI